MSEHETNGTNVFECGFLGDVAYDQVALHYQNKCAAGTPKCAVDLSAVVKEDKQNINTASKQRDGM